MPDGCEVVLKILSCVLLDPMLFQEAIELVARRDAQESAELVARQAAFTVGFEGEGFQCSASGVPAGRGESRGQMVGISRMICMPQRIMTK